MIKVPTRSGSVNESIFTVIDNRYMHERTLVEGSTILGNEERFTFLGFIEVLIETPLDGIEAVAGSLDMATKHRGALTGARLTQRALEVVRYIAEKTEHNYPIIGSGGMMQPEDIKAMLEAGASLVALNTGLRENGLRLLKRGAKAIVSKDKKDK